MSGLSDARTELATALETVPDLRVYPEPNGTFATPCIRLHPAGPWLAPSVLAAGNRTQRWEVWCVLGRMDSTANYDELETMVSNVTDALDRLPGWSGIMWDRPNPTDMGGTKYLAVRGIIETKKGV